MARIHGKKGRVYVGLADDSATAEPVANLSSWSFDSAVDFSDVPAFGDTNKQKVAGLPDAVGAFAGWYDTASDQLYTASRDGLARKMYLYPSTDDGDYFYGTAYFDFSVTTPVDGPVAITSNWGAASDILKVSA